MFQQINSMPCFLLLYYNIFIIVKTYPYRITNQMFYILDKWMFFLENISH